MNKLKEITNKDRFTILVAVLCLFFALHCSKKETASGSKKAKAGKLNLTPEIDSVTLEPSEPLSINHIRAQATLKTKLFGVTYSYQWYINGDAAEGLDTKLLSADETVKGDDVYCRVTAIKGSTEFGSVDSEKVEIKNSRPQLNLAPVSPFEIPGRFLYQIIATDPDNDALTYKLISPLDRGIRIDHQNGQISWDLEPLPVKDKSADINRSEGGNVPFNKDHSEKEDEDSDKFSPQVKIVFQVTDTDGAAVTGSITLNLTQGSEVPQ